MADKSVFSRLQKLFSTNKYIRFEIAIDILNTNGEFSDYEMNELYNNPKVKAMVTTTKGEGFGRPLLEFSAVGKPIIASGWSGHLDFLNPSFTYLLPGNLENVHPSAANNWWQIEWQSGTYSTIPTIKSISVRFDAQTDASYFKIEGSDSGNFTGEETDYGVFAISSENTILNFG